MSTLGYPKFETRHGYMSEQIQRAYIASAIEQKLLPDDAHRDPQIISLDAPNDAAKPIQFWQLYSVLGQDPIVKIVADFYQRVFADEDWFTSVFARVGPYAHHVNTQASMWVDVMGGGPYYHGAEFRLNFHHTHNAMALMNEKGAERWTMLMLETLENTSDLMKDDPRVRRSINTFLAHFMSKYAAEFLFENKSVFGETNPPYRRKINFMRMTQEAIEALSETELREALAESGVDASVYADKEALVAKAMML